MAQTDIEMLLGVLARVPKKELAFFASGRVHVLKGIVEHHEGVLVTLEPYEHPDPSPADESEAADA